ncbi:cytochrome [Mycobacterium sp. 852013-51886_SCH5428379]|uniref:cytochrome P450 n=1 Tax=Mycobacterium sp. 852013-51886_SCH5428379 TaxID=1834111 RepID=UPI0007FDBC9C|nr:cytochrome P450 [Mycobacterium sp. 852013-51886_SCH5428379]OBB57260.1 cytochrome [Mycobacterium sp. 852013-51886_SCH5428379]
MSESHRAYDVCTHADVVRVLDDHTTFSNAVSTQHVAVPNGMDPPQHTMFRAVVDRYFTADRLAAFEPRLRALTAELVAGLPRDAEFDFVDAFAEPYAGRAQCAFMGWPDALQDALREWVKRNHAAVHAQDRQAMAAVALAFDGYIREQLDARRQRGAPTDTTTDLLSETVDGRPLRDDEIVSIVRNWTVGELGTIAAGVGILAQTLAAYPEVQDQLRADPTLIEPACDEILRLHAPLISNRRRTTREVTLGASRIPADAPLTVVWAAANRDPLAFDDVEQYRLDRDPSLNLLYGRGIHICPGAPLARMEFRIVLEELFAGTRRITLGGRAVAATYPSAGFSELSVRLG